MNAGDQPRRVVVVGLDGASLELLGPWIQEGHMPNLARLIATGVSGGLESVVPPLTPPAWTTAVTGVSPAKHGILNFARPRFGTRALDFFNAFDRRVPALWDYLAAKGRKSLILHLPAAHPPFAIDGALISGIPLTDIKTECTYPPDLRDELIANVANYKLFPNTFQLKGNRDAYFHDAIATLKAHADEAVYLMGTRQWDLLFTVWQPGDSLMHFYWKDMEGRGGEPARRDYIRDYYREADAGIGRILDAAGPNAHVIVMSDHGHTGVHGAVYLNKWLVDAGFLTYRTSMKQAFEFLVLKLQRKFHRKLRRKKKFNESEDQMLQIAARLLEKLESSIVWNRTKAHAEPPGYVWICSSDRYPAGPVAPGDEYRKVRDEIRRGFAALRDPQTGEPVFERILTKEEAFDGPASEDAPDLVLLCRAGFITEYGLRKNFVVGPAHGARFNGYHVMRGMFAGVGPEFRSNAIVEGSRIVDIAPTILHLLDLPVPPELEGEVLVSAFEDSALARRPVRVEPIGVAFEPKARGDLDQGAIEQSLRDLGYM